MKDHIFGNLMDWGYALDTLHLLRDSGSLDDHQDELIRLLRYDKNWLRAITKIHGKNEDNCKICKV